MQLKEMQVTASKKRESAGFIYKETNPTPNKKSKLAKPPSTYI